MKTSELTGAALDWAVAKCEGVTVLPKMRGGCYVTLDRGDTVLLCYSTNWAQGGPIIERERMTLEFLRWDDVDAALPVWLATRIERHSVCEAEGFSPLIAAMRCFVASKLGEEVEIPNELQGE